VTIYGGHFAQTERNSIVLRYLSPRSAIIVTMVPDLSVSATCRAPATAAPLDMPAKIPSSRLSRRVISNASSSCMVTMSSSSAFPPVAHLQVVDFGDDGLSQVL